MNRLNEMLLNLFIFNESNYASLNEELFVQSFDSLVHGARVYSSVDVADKYRDNLQDLNTNRPPSLFNAVPVGTL